MTEQEKLISSTPYLAEKAKNQRQNANQAQATLNRKEAIEWIVRLTIPAAFLTMVFYTLLYFQTDAWQLLVAAGGMIIALVGFFLARSALQRGHLDRAGYWILSMVIMAYMCLGLAFSGASLWLILGGILVVLLLGTLTLPQRWLVWSVGAVLLSIYFGMLDLFEPLPRYDIAQSTLVSLYIPSITFFLLVIYIWQLVRIFQQGNIRSRLLIAFVSVVLLTAIAGIVSSTLIGFQTGQARAIEQLEAAALLKDSEINAWTDDLQSELATLLSQDSMVLSVQFFLESPKLSISESNLRDHLQESMGITNRFIEFFLLDRQGQVLLSTDPSQEGEMHAREAYFQRGLQIPYISAPFYWPVKDQISIVATRPVLDNEGQPLGVLAGRANLTRLNEIILKETGIGNTSVTYLVGMNKILLTDLGLPEYPVAEARIRTVSVNEAIESRANDPGHRPLYKDFQGISVIGTYRWLPQLKVALILEQTQAEAFRSVYTNLIVNLATALGAVVIAVLFGLLVTRNIATPLAQLSDVAAQIAAGNLTLKAEIDSQNEIGDLALAFNQMTERLRNSIETLEYRVQERTRALDTGAEISREMTAILDLEALLQHVVNRIQTEFTFYHTHIYLMDDETGDLIMAEGFGDVGQQLKEAGHRLAAGEGIVGTVASTNEHFLSNNVNEVLNFVRNDLLPETNSELAVPLRKGDSVLGVLDIQDRMIDRFSPADVTLMQSIANQIAVAIDNIRLVKKMQEAVMEVERLNSRLTREGWQVALEETQHAAYRFVGGDRKQVTPAPDSWLTSMKQAAKHKELVTYEPGNGNKKEIELAVPLMLRGQVIGVMGVKKKETRTWAEEEIAAVRAVANQTSLALESARLSEEQERTIVQLREVDRLKSEFLTSMSHELRTPLNSIIGFADILLQGIDGPLTDNALTDITAIHNSGRHLLALINNLLDLSKIEAGRMELACNALSIPDMFSEVAASASSLLAKKPVDLIFDLPETLPMVWADPLRLSQILLNLVSNAIKFTEEGTVTMKAEVNSQQLMEISVTDTGIGIPEDKFDLVFEQFRQVDARTNRKYQGTGMGLAIAKQLAELHGGTMWVDSVPSEGATFTFTIPIATEAQIAEA